MAELDDRERTESPTPKRLDDARKRGQVARSRDLSAAATTLAAGLGLYSLGGAMGGGLMVMMRACLSFSRADATVGTRMTEIFGQAGWSAAQACMPLFGLLLAAAVLAPLMIGGWTFSTSAIGIQWQRLDPITGLGRVFSSRGIFEVLKALARFAVVAFVAVLLLRNQFRSFIALGAESPVAGIGDALRLAGQAFIILGASLGLIAMIDVPLTLWYHNRSLRMSKQEIREEAKETDGSPEVRGRIRRVQQDMARRRMMAEVQRADVIVTNPTHYAVALRYDESRMRAPTVVAKGVDLIALQIRKVAAEHRVPVIEAPPLARALHAGCELGAEVPTRLYAAVAQLLTYVYQLRAATRVGRSAPPPPTFDAV